MPIDRKALKQRMKEEKAKGRAVVKAIPYPLPDLRGPGGNAFALLGSAAHLMKQHGVSEALQSEFHSEATSGEYEHLLETIQEWFTVCVSDTTYVPLPEGQSILQYKPNADGEYAEWEDDPDEETDEDTDSALASMEANEERDRQVAEAEKRVTAQIRAELGLDEDDVVIVQIKKAPKKKG